MATVLVGGWVALLLSAQPVFAHASLVHSDPVNGATLAKSPLSVRLWFDEEITPEASSARLLDSNGKVVDEARLTAAVDARILERELPHLAPGTYGIWWSVIGYAGGCSFELGWAAPPYRFAPFGPVEARCQPHSRKSC
jgi:copper transport protein